MSAVSGRKQDQMNFHKLGAVLMVAVHVALAGGIYAADRMAGHGYRMPAAGKDPPHIEAGLAIKGKKAAGKPSKQPQKEFTHKVKPSDVSVTKHDRPSDPKKPDEQFVPPEHQDRQSVFDKYRNKNTEDPAVKPDPASEQGSDEENKDGDPNGSDRGTLLTAKGDPYLGELVGRMGENFEVAQFPRDGGALSAWGCVKLDGDGSIVDYLLDEKHKSKNPGFNSAVEESLRKSKTLKGEPVPDHLKDMLVGKFVCVTFGNDE